MTNIYFSAVLVLPLFCYLFRIIWSYILLFPKSSNNSGCKGAAPDTGFRFYHLHINWSSSDLFGIFCIASKVNTKPGEVQETYLDNKQFMEMLKISPRTAQTWRDEGKISFSQVGSKIYYRLSDFEKCMETYYNKSFSKK